MKDYDDEVRRLEGVTRQFVLRGIEFHAKPTMPAEHLSALADMQTGVDTAHSYGTCTAAIRATLLEEYRPAWDELLGAEQRVPISLGTLMKIADDLVEEATGRPPTPPTPSGTTVGNGSTRSTDGFASTVQPGLASSSPAPGST